MVALPMTLSALNHLKPPYFLHFALPSIASYRVNLETSYLVHWLTIARPTLPKKIFPERGVVRVK